MILFLLEGSNMSCIFTTTQARQHSNGGGTQ